MAPAMPLTDLRYKTIDIGSQDAVSQQIQLFSGAMTGTFVKARHITPVKKFSSVTPTVPLARPVGGREKIVLQRGRRTGRHIRKLLCSNHFYNATSPAFLFPS